MVCANSSVWGTRYITRLRLSSQMFKGIILRIYVEDLIFQLDLLNIWRVVVKKKLATQP